MQSQFTISQMIKMLAFVTEPADENKIKNEIAYMLNIREVGEPYERREGYTIDKQLRELSFNANGYEFNPKVLVVLIESGYIQQ